MTESLFIRTLGDYPVIRVLDFLLENRIFDYSKSDIAKQANVSRTTLDNFWGNLLKGGIVKKTRVIGRAVMYQFNSKSEISKKLIEMDFALSKQFAEKEKTPVPAHSRN